MSLAEETAIVRFIDGKYAYLKAESASACSSCSAKSACGANTISTSKYNLRIKNTNDLKEGDVVVLTLESNKLLLGTIIMYILPLIMLFIFAYFGKIIGGEPISAIGGGLGLFSGLIIINKIINKDQLSKQFEPKVIRVNSRNILIS